MSERYQMIFWLYSTALTLALLLWAPWKVLGALLAGRSLPPFRQRLGFLPSVPPEAFTIWIHAVSVGEVLATRPLIPRLQANLPSFRLVISTVTDTGQNIARSLYGDRALTIYFPFDWAFSVRRALDHINPDLVLIMETEIWPHFLHECHRRGIPTVLVNGRISERSFRRYLRLRGFIAETLNKFSYLLMQSDTDAQRVLALGANPHRVKVVGNLKWDATITPEEREKVAEFSRIFALSPSPSSPLIVAASTGQGEEEIVVTAFKKVRETMSPHISPRLVIAPRRPERFNQVERIIQASDLCFVRRSRVTSPVPHAPIILLDTIGELSAFYHVASVTILGGSLLGSASHNIAEPLLRGCPVIIGPGFPESALPVHLQNGPSPVIRLPQESRSEPAALADALASAVICLLRQGAQNETVVPPTQVAREYPQGATEKSLPYIIATLASKNKQVEAQNSLQCLHEP